MKQYTKTIDNKIEIRRRDQITIKGNGVITYNPTEEMLLEDGWVEYILTEPPTPTPEELLNTSKENKINEILEYDSSSDVNIFYIQSIPIWLDKSTRVGLRLRFEAELENSKTETILWYNNMQFTLNLDDAMKMLHKIEIYASQCYDNTHKHIAIVSNLSTTEEIDNYDYKTGYPDKLDF